MHREVSFAVEIAVALIALSAIIGIIWFTMFLGKDMANEASFEASDMMSRTEVATLESIMSKGETEMPLATAYTILRMNSYQIPSFYCKCNDCTLHQPSTRQNLTNQAPCVLRHLSSPLRVKMKVEIDNSGAYKVTLSDIS